MIELFMLMGLSSYSESTAFAFHGGGSHGLYLIFIGGATSTKFDFEKLRYLYYPT